MACGPLPINTLEETTGRLRGVGNPLQDSMSGERDLIKPELSVFLNEIPCIQGLCCSEGF